MVLYIKGINASTVPLRHTFASPVETLMIIRTLATALTALLLTAFGAQAQESKPQWVEVTQYQAQLGTSGTMTFTGPDRATHVVNVVVPKQTESTKVDGQAILNGKPAHMFARKYDAGVVVTFRVANDTLHFGNLRFQEWKMDLKTGQTYVLHGLLDDKQVEFAGMYTKN